MLFWKLIINWIPIHSQRIKISNSKQFIILINFLNIFNKLDNSDF